VVPPASDDTAEFGTTVTFRMGGQTRVLAIVGDDEADPAAGRIAYSAPLARALIGAEPGEVLPFGGKEDGIEVLTIAAGTPD